jgi:integrase
VHGVVRKALNDAVLWGLLAKNPALRAAVPKRRRPVMTVWTPEQASAFLAATTGDRMQACWLLALSTGMRRGELAGLSWSDLDLDLERGRLQVTSHLQPRRGRHAARGRRAGRGAAAAAQRPRLRRAPAGEPHRRLTAFVIRVPRGVPRG